MAVTRRVLQKEEDRTVIELDIGALAENVTESATRKFVTADEKNQIAEIPELKKSVSDGKALVAAAITAKKIATAATATFAEMAANIAKIVTGGGTAEPDDVLEGKTIVGADGVETGGTMKNLTARTTITHTSSNATKVIEGDAAFVATNSDGTDRVEIRYSGDAGYITPNTLFGVARSVMVTAIGLTAGLIKFGSSILGITGTFTGDGTATAAQILSGMMAYVKGAKVTGTMANQGAQTAALNCGGSYTIPAGYHNGQGKVTANSLSSQTGANAAAANILSGKTAWVNGSKVTGTIASLAGSTITPSGSQQTVSCSGKYMTGNVVVNPIPSSYLAPGNWSVFNYGAFPISGLGLAPYYYTTNVGATYPTSEVSSRALHEYTDDGLQISYAGSSSAGSSLFFNKLFPIKKLKSVSYIVNAALTGTSTNYSIMVHMLFSYKNEDGTYTAYLNHRIVNVLGGSMGNASTKLKDYSGTLNLADILADCPYDELAIGFGISGARTIAYLKSFSIEF